MLIEEAKFLLENIDLQSIELNYGSNAIIISPKEENIRLLNGDFVFSELFIEALETLDVKVRKAISTNENKAAFIVNKEEISKIFNNRLEIPSDHFLNNLENNNFILPIISIFSRIFNAHSAEERAVE
jgi:hypothetical protein